MNFVAIILLMIATFQQSFTVFAVLYVFGFGMRNSLTYMVPVHHSWLWFPSRPGLASGVIIAAFGFGALVFNTISLQLINPDNESADKDGKFTDEV